MQSDRERQYPGRPGSNSNQLDISVCLSEAWQAFKVNPGLAIGGLLLWYVIYFVAALVPILNFFTYILIFPPLLLGLAYFFLNLAGRGTPNINDLWAGFNHYGKTMGIYWLGTAVLLIVMVPWILATVAMGMISPMGEPDPSQLVGLFGIFGLVMVIVAWLNIRFAWAYFIALDEPERDVIDCFRRSWQISSGHTGSIILLALVGFLIALAGFLALIVGVFVAAPLCYLLFARAYLWLKSFRPEPVAATPPPQSSPPESAPPTTV